METNLKQIDSCVKMFALLRLLLEDNADFAKVFKVISETTTTPCKDTRVFSVTLNKYLNTLKLFGLNVRKEKGKYYLVNPPYKLELSTNELKSFITIKELAENFNDEDSEEFNKFLKSFELRFSERTQLLARTMKSTHSADFSFYYSNSANKIDTCSKFCREDFKVEIIYYSGKREKKITAKAQELLYRKGIVKLQVLNLITREPLAIPVSKIISIKQLPSKITSNYTTNRVIVYGLKGRLAKNYSVRPWEYTNGYENDWLIVVNKNENEEELSKRILKYGNMCKVFSPADFRDKITKIIDNTLKLYE